MDTIAYFYAALSYEDAIKPALRSQRQSLNDRSVPQSNAQNCYGYGLGWFSLI